MNRKLKAFTLFELVISMVLSALVIGMVYNGWAIISTIYDRYGASSRQQSELMSLARTLQKDVDNAVSVQARPAEVMLLDSLGSPALSYLIRENLLIRKSQLLDTFQLDQLQVDLRFEGSTTQAGLVDELSVEFSYDKIPVRLLIDKKYSGQQLFNQ